MVHKLFAVWITIFIMIGVYGLIEIEYTNKNYRYMVLYPWLATEGILLGYVIWNM